MTASDSLSALAGGELGPSANGGLGLLRESGLEGGEEGESELLSPSSESGKGGVVGGGPDTGPPVDDGLGGAEIRDSSRYENPKDKENSDSGVLVSACRRESVNASFSISGT